MGAIIVEVNGVGYEVSVPLSTQERLPELGRIVKIYISESTSMYGGGTKLYGFLTEEELEVFGCMKDNLANTGAKKALEYLDKADELLAKIEREGWTWKTKKTGAIHKHPLIQHEEKTREQFTKLWNILHLDFRDLDFQARQHHGKTQIDH